MTFNRQLASEVSLKEGKQTRPEESAKIPTVETYFEVGE